MREDPLNNRPITQCPFTGNITVLDWLWEHGSSESGCIHKVSKKDSSSALHTAVGSGHLNVVKWLHMKGANMNHIDGDGMCALHRVSDLDIAQFLYENGCASTLNRKTETAATTASRNSIKAGLEQIMGNLGASLPSVPGMDGTSGSRGHTTPLGLIEQVMASRVNCFSAERLRKMREVREQFLAWGAVRDPKNTPAEELLFAGAKFGDIRMMSKAITAGANLVNCRDVDRGFSALWMAAAKGGLAAVKWIVENGGESLVAEATFEGGWTPIGIAAQVRR